MYSIEFEKEARKALLSLPKNTSALIREKIEAIAASPYAQHNNAKKLEGKSGYRLRVGDWRVIYEIQNDRLVVLVVKIGSRGGVYQ
jgi:mRNA interferase RelE/StbE